MAVVDRVVEAVGGAGGGQGEHDVDVEPEGLGLGLLVGQHADDARQPEAAQLDQVVGSHGRRPYGFGIVPAMPTRSRPSGHLWRDSRRSLTDVACGASGTKPDHRRYPASKPAKRPDSPAGCQRTLPPGASISWD